MEHKPLLLQLTESESRPDFQMGADGLDFEFPTAVSSSAVPNDVVLCGKVISRKTQPAGENKSPFRLRSESSLGRPDRLSGSARWLRSESQSSSRKHRNGLFGIVKFPLQMELSDMKMRQERRKLLRLPMQMPVAEGEGGGESCWDMVRPLRPRSRLINALAKATFGCIPIV